MRPFQNINYINYSLEGVVFFFYSVHTWRRLSRNKRREPRKSNSNQSIYKD